LASKPGSDTQGKTDQQMMADMLDRSGVYVWEAGNDLIISNASNGFCQLLSLSLAAVTGQSIHNLKIQFCGAETWSSLIDQLSLSDDPVTLFADMINGDGTNIRCQLCFQPKRDEDRQFSGFIGTCRVDASNHRDKPGTPEAVEDQTWFRDLAHANADWFWEIDAELRFTYISDAQEKITGVPNTTFLGVERWKIEGVEDNEALKRHLDDLSSRRAFRDYTYSLEAADGRIHWYRTSGIPKFDSEGSFSGYRGIGSDITEQQNALIQSRQSEAMLFDALELTPVGLTLWDENEKFVIANAGLKAQMPDYLLKNLVPGVSFEEYSRSVAYSGYIPEAIGNEELWVKSRVERHREAYSDVWENSRADGTWLQISTYKTNSGGMLVTYTDVTELKSREEELGNAQSQLNDALEAIDQGFIIYDADDRLVLVNSAFKKMFPGSDKYLFPGARFEDVFRSGAIIDEQNDIEAYVKERKERRHAHGGRQILQSKDGSWKIVTSSRSRDGGTVSVWTDVTQLKAQEQALRDSENRFSIAFHSSPLMMAIAQLDDGAYVEVNEKFVALTGYSRTELIGPRGQSVPLIANDEDRGLIRSKLMRGQAINEMEVVFRRKSGELFEVLISGDLIEVAGEQRILLIGMDFSGHKRLENSLIGAKNEAEFANRTKSEFLANMSHELRTPLNAVIGFSEFLANEAFGPLGDPRYLEYIGDIRDSGTHLLNLINEILDVSKVEAGKMELREGEVELDDMMVRCIRSVGGRARAAGLTISGTVDSEMPFLLCDETKLRQILINVLNNAVKFTDEGGTIEVGAEINDDGDLDIRISDTGIGIAESDMDAVFRVFGQAETTMDRRFEGAGLGLPLTKALVELHDGVFRLESELGVGTTVVITFPAVRLVDRNAPAS
jgi:PAS domain S-box-containing protein